MTPEEREEAADYLDQLRGVDEGEYCDTDRLEHLARVLREDAGNDDVPKWLREMLGPHTPEERRQRRLDLIAEVIALREDRDLQRERAEALGSALDGQLDLAEKVDLISSAGMLHADASETMRQALGSLIDLVDELCMGLAVGQSPDRAWAEAVSQTLGEHRKKLGFQPPEF